MTTVVEHGSEYEILRFDVGRKNEEGSYLALKLTTDTPERLQDLLSRLSVFGCYVKGTPEAILRSADMDGAALAGKPNMIGALQRLMQNKDLVDNSQPQLATLKINGGKGFMSLIQTHPPLEVRIAALQRGV